MRIFDTSYWNNYPRWIYNESTHHAYWADRQNHHIVESSLNVEIIIDKGSKEELPTFPLELQVDEGL